MAVGKAKERKANQLCALYLMNETGSDEIT
jgi:hypothetical protein